MLAHDLARRLLAGPNLPVGFHDADILEWMAIPVVDIVEDRVVEWGLDGDEWGVRLIPGLRFVGEEH